MSKRILSIILALAVLLITVLVPIQHAKAVAVTTVVVSAVIAAMAAVGIGMAVAGLTSAEIQSWVSDKLTTWATSVGSTVEDLIPPVGIGATLRGFFVIGTAAAQGIASFINWLKQDQSLANNATVQVYSTAAIFRGVACNYFGSLTIEASDVSSRRLYTRVYSTADIYCFRNDTTSQRIVRMYSNGPFVIEQVTTQTLDSGVSNEINRTYNNASYSSIEDYYYYSVAYPYSYHWNGQSVDNPTLGLINYQTMPTFSADQQATPGSTLSLHTGVMTTPTIGAEDKWYIDVGAAAGSTATEVGDTVMTKTIANTLTASGEIADSEPQIELNGPIPIQGLEEVFPFCIPFDIYNLVGVLAADPVAPVINWRVYLPGLCDETIVIDLSAFNDVAAVCRKLELLLFCVGLAFVTRHLIRS